MRFLAGLQLTALTMAVVLTSGTWVSDVGSGLAARLEGLSFPVKPAVRGSRLGAFPSVQLFYQRRAFDPAWTSQDRILPQTQSLLEAIRETDQEGLVPSDYHLQEIETIVGRDAASRLAGSALGADELTDLDVLLTDAFLTCATHLLSGRIDPHDLDSRWAKAESNVDLAEALEKGLANGRIRETLLSLHSTAPEYARLRRAYAEYRTLAARGGWASVPNGAPLKKGDFGERVSALRFRLVASGDLREEDVLSPEIFDSQVEEALQRFQRRHGLAADGIAGPGTFLTLRVPAEIRANQIALNLEKWRWSPQALGDSYVLVKIPDFTVEAVDGQRVILNARAIVGKNYRRTPVFSSRITEVVFSPIWNVPSNIARNDILPRIRKDADYLDREGIRVFLGSEHDAIEVDPHEVNWNRSEYRKRLPYSFRQDPGPSNPLGGVKFIFRNDFNVYLHDTPSRNLFDEERRTFSSGCIRVEKAEELARYVLRNDPYWTQDRVRNAMDAGCQQTIRLSQPIPVHLRYWTAWVDSTGTVQFRDDVYGWDERLEKGLLSSKR